MSAKKSIPEKALFDISTVARLTGLSTANIRIWEKRYEVVQPERSESGRRLYTEQDVSRLTLLKTLSDHGHPIRTTASLAHIELEKRLREATNATNESDPTGKLPSFPATKSGSCLIAVIGHGLVSMLAADRSRLKGTRTVAEFHDLEAAEAGPLPDQVDLLIVECPTLFTDTTERIRRLIDMTHAVRAIVVYQFAQNQTIQLADESLSRITAIRAPVTSSELAVACRADIALANRIGSTALASAPPPRTQTDEIPERRFSDAQVAQISNVSSNIECECPRHLGSVLNSLLGFEKYSRECESRNAADAEIHAYLHKTTAHARATIEDALKVLVEFEGIEVSE